MSTLIVILSLNVISAFNVIPAKAGIQSFALTKGERSGDVEGVRLKVA